MNKKEIKTLTDFALRQAVAYDEIRIAMTRPYNHENGNTYATDGRVLLCIPSSICKKYEPFKDVRFPNVVSVMEDHILNSKDTHMNLMLANMVDTYSNVRIGNVIISNVVYNKVRNITAILGLRGWHVRECEQSLVLENELIKLLVMCIVESENELSIPLSSCFLDKFMHVDDAKEYIKVLEAKEKKEREEDDIRSCIYEFVVARYATMYVKADSFLEAKRIANEHRHDIDSWDFEDPEIDSYDDIPGEPETNMETIFTDEGECTYEEVCEMIEEEVQEFRSES